jgi:formylglycine-generating enzyme required for sulfatase activity
VFLLSCSKKLPDVVNTPLGGGSSDVCPNIKRPDEPSVVSWDASALSSLKARMNQGGVVVRYSVEGCKAELEPLPYCVVKGAKYQYQWLPGTEKIEARSSREVFAELPLGAASLSGKLSGGKMLRVDVKQAGLSELPFDVKLDREALEGDCDRATHVVARFYLGGFTMVSGESKQLSAKASIFGFGGGGEAEQGLSVENSVGQKAACDAAQEKDEQQAGCSFPLRIGLRSLRSPASNAAAAPPQPVATALPAAPQPIPRQGQNVATTPPRVSTPSAPPSSLRGGPMVRLEGGTFTMGSNDGDEDEKPTHSVTLKPFWMDVTEVTVAAYKVCVDAGACSKPGDGGFCNWGKSDRSNHPINCVDWEQATSFCRWANKRLPTEEEWEYGARQGGVRGDRKYPWGDAEPASQLCWNRYGDGKPNSSCPVGSFSAGDTPTGLKDMAGNVWEWTSSAYCPYTSSGYDVGKCESARVSRGGSWLNNYASNVRGADRYRFTPSVRIFDLGFRCARADLFYSLPALGHI